MTDANAGISTHMARSAMNNDPAVRDWVEQWLKRRERDKYLATEGADDAAFEKHWRYVKPETMHEGALEAYRAYVAETTRPTS